MKIGFFDSGLGGLTILTAVRGLLPEYDYLFYGDTKNIPYGDKSQGEVHTLTKAGVQYLFSHGAQLVIVACNTASVESVRKLQESLKGSEYHDCKILGVVIPTIEALVDSGIPRAVLIGTTRTVTSGKYERELIKLSSEIEIVGYATPTLVALIESNNIALAQKQADALIKLFEREGDVLVLGCTHYTVLKEHIRQKTKMQVISQDEVIPIKLKNYLERHPEIESKLSRNGTVEVILSEENLEYRNRIEILLTT